MSAILSPPVSARDHIRGPDIAPVTLLEYGDYQCSYCGLAYPIVKSVVARMGVQLRFVFRNFPLRELHPHAQLAAEAAEAAGAQRRFWEMHDALYENQRDLTGAALMRYAGGLVPDPSRWARDIQERTFAGRVQEDLAGGVRSRVHGTPTFFVNGQPHLGPHDEDSLLTAIASAALRHAPGRAYGEA